MTKRKIKVSTISIRLPSPMTKKNCRTIEVNLKKAGELLKKAGDAGSDITLLPECFATKGILSTFSNMKDAAQRIPEGKIAGFAAAYAKKYSMYIIAPIIEKSGKQHYNTAALFDRKGNCVGKYRKTHLPAPNERRDLVPGTELPVFTTDFGKIGICICYDLNFPEVVRTLCLKGAEVIFWPTLWGMEKEYVLSYIKGQALANIVHVVSANFSMKKKGGHPGQSCIVDPNGKILANTGNRTGVATAIIALGKTRNTEKKELMAHRRPQLYY